MADEQRQLGFDQLGIGNVLSRNTLIVPPNQREYSWTDREVMGLLTDLTKAIAANAPEYFLGTVVSIPRKPGVIEVVDGQQRLATTAILLAAIRDVLKGRKADELIVERIENSFLSTIDATARERVARLSLNTTDNAYFDRRVLKGQKSEPAIAKSHRLLDAAANAVAKHVKGLVRTYEEKDYGDVLNRWVEFLEHRAMVILLKVPNSMNAYKMFETLNDRGLRTSQADLVKNYLFGECNERLQEGQQKWGSMKAILESLDDDDLSINFLRQMMISLYGYLREPDVYEVVQKNAKGATSSLNFLRKLETGASDYAAMLNAEHEKWNKYPTTTRRAIQALILLKMRPVRPLILSVIREFETKEADKALRMLVNLSVRFLIVGGARSGGVEQVLAGAAKDVSDQKTTGCVDLLDSLKKVIPADAEFEGEFKVATVSQAHLARYYLRSLEMAAKGEPNPYFIPNDDQQVINLEHVLPKEPGANWPEFSKDAAEAFYKRLGNMALLRAQANSDLHSSPFREKRKAYRQSPYELTRQISEAASWTTESIEERQKQLATLAVKTWKI